MEGLEGERIILREYRPDDALEIWKWKNDKATTLWMGRRFRNLPTLRQAREGLGKAMAEKGGTALFFAIAEKANGRYIGGIDLTDIDRIDANAVLSMVIGAEGDRGKGYATEAIRLILAHAFSELRLHKVSLNVYEDNQAALKCYLKNGFKAEGRIEDHMFINGRYRDLIPMAIFDSEFRDGPHV